MGAFRFAVCPICFKKRKEGGRCPARLVVERYIGEFVNDRRATLSENRPALADGAPQKGQVSSAPLVGTRPLTPPLGGNLVLLQP